MEFLKRPVAPYFVPVPGLDGIAQRPKRTAVMVRAARHSSAVRPRRPTVAGPRHGAGAAAVAPHRRRARARRAHGRGSSAYLADPDAGVRRTAVAVLTEHLPDELRACTARCARRRRRRGPRAPPPMASANSSRCCRIPLPLRHSWTPPIPSCAQPSSTYSAPAGSGRRPSYRRSAGRPRPPGPHRGRARTGVRRRRGRRGRRPARRQPRGAHRGGQRHWARSATGASTIRALIADPDPLVRAAALAALGAGRVGRGGSDHGRARPCGVGVAGQAGCRPCAGRCRRRRRPRCPADARARPIRTSTCARRRC